MDLPDVNVDSIIERLLEGDYRNYDYFILINHHKVRGNRPGKQVQLGEHEIRYLCLTAREIFMSQPILLDLEAPIKICGKLNYNPWMF